MLKYYSSLVNKVNSYQLFWLTIFAFASLAFTKYYFLFTNEFYPPAYAYKIANFEADKVFQKRFLVPISADILTRITPLSFDQSLKCFTLLSILGLLYYFKKILEKLTNTSFGHFWSLLLLIPVSWNYMCINSIYHSYDIPAIFFYSACLYHFINRKYILFYIIFIIATFNRESTCFITISIALLFCDFNLKKNFQNNKSIIRHLLTQTTLWFLLIFVIDRLVNDSPGQAYEATYSIKQFFWNMIAGLPSWPYLNNERFFGNPRCFLTLFGCVWIAIPFLHKHIPAFCKRLLLLIPIYLVPALLYANIMEARVYHELNVVISLAVVTGLIQLKNSICINSAI